MAMAVMMKRAAQRFRSGIQRAGYSESQRVLNEEEKAAENMYIKRMEQERLEKLRQKAEEQKQSGASTEAPDGTPKTPEEASLARNKAIALGAGVVALLCGVYWVVSTPPEKKQNKVSDKEEAQA